MSTLTLELFLSAYKDYEARQYQILSEISKIRRDFSNNRIYPTLSKLTDLYVSLRKIAEQSHDIRGGMPRRITGFDVKTQRIFYETLSLNHADLEAVEELIQWSLPHIQKAIEEGQTIYNFVDDHMKVEEVGLLPSYVEEGYLLIPDPRAGALHVLRYEVSIFTSADERYRNLKTTSVKMIPMTSVSATPLSIKQTLIGEHRELPNPATYVFQTDLDFPFQETILPVAKRKFLRRLYS